MKYDNITEAKFIDRPNRFIAHCRVGKITETVHVKNTGRCRELLTPEATVYLEKSDNPNRKTKYDLVAVMKGNTLINMDSQSPNKAAYQWLCDGNFLAHPTIVKPEKKYGNSRFDFYLENEKEKAFVEVKGVTLEKDGTAMFPDAPTERGTKHLNELISAKKAGYRSAVLFVVQMKGCNEFKPNTDTDKHFAAALQKANDNGVEVLVYDCKVTPDSMVIDKPVTAILK